MTGNAVHTLHYTLEAPRPLSPCCMLHDVPGVEEVEAKILCLESGCSRNNHRRRSMGQETAP